MHGASLRFLENWWHSVFAIILELNSAREEIEKKERERGRKAHWIRFVQRDYLPKQFGLCAFATWKYRNEFDNGWINWNRQVHSSFHTWDKTEFITSISNPTTSLDFSMCSIETVVNFFFAQENRIFNFTFGDVLVCWFVNLLWFYHPLQNPWKSPTEK